MTRRLLLKILALIPFLRRLLEPAPEVAGWDSRAESMPWKNYSAIYTEAGPIPTECYGIPYWIEPGKIDTDELLRVMRRHEQLCGPRIVEIIVGSAMHDVVMAEAGRLFSRGSIELTIESGRAVRIGNAPVRLSAHLRPKQIIIKYSDETLANWEAEE